MIIIKIENGLKLNEDNFQNNNETKYRFLKYFKRENIF